MHMHFGELSMLIFYGGPRIVGCNELRVSMPQSRTWVGYAYNGSLDSCNTKERIVEPFKLQWDCVPILACAQLS